MAKIRGRQYSYDAGQPSVTKQEFKDECDVNIIVGLYKKGTPLPMQIEQGQFKDVDCIKDYKQALDQMQEAQEVMDTVPLEIRETVGGTPAGFIDYVNDPDNAEQLEAWGLIEGSVPDTSVPDPDEAAAGDS